MYPVNPVEQSLSLLWGFSYLVSPQRRKERRENQGFATAWGLRYTFAKACHERKRKGLNPLRPQRLCGEQHSLRTLWAQVIEGSPAEAG